MTETLLADSFGVFGRILNGSRLDETPLFSALMQEAFYAGAATVVGEMVDLRDDDPAAERLLRLAAELRAHVHDMKLA